ncbi:hypothetical protein EV421DRAFT_1739268 [Armillaria borealis]|uniref:Uncharacterized protein n=1 Tax=Armillaria borealis TaxID=47425 RepID=A0AA39MKD2_9AGAR|nr:hypothetical protein EV421DRAFT_1739268 [Armillaria borealis]
MCQLPGKPRIPFNNFAAPPSTFSTSLAIWLQLVHRPRDLPQTVPITKLWECPDPHCPATYSSIHLTISGQFTMDTAYPHDMVPFAWGFQEIRQVWGSVDHTPLSTLDKEGIHVTWGLMKNFHICNPPPLEWPMDEETLLPLIVIEDSIEKDDQDLHGLVDKSLGPSLQHTMELSVDGRALVVAAATANLSAGSKEEVLHQQSVASLVPAARVANPEIISGNIKLGITLQEWCKDWETSYNPQLPTSRCQSNSNNIQQWDICTNYVKESHHLFCVMGRER